MGLLLKVVEEYLKDDHPNWAITESYPSSTMYIDRLAGGQHYVKIDGHDKTVSVYDICGQQPKYKKYYNETTVLTLISEAISRAE